MCFPFRRYQCRLLRPMRIPGSSRVTCSMLSVVSYIRVSVFVIDRLFPNDE